MGIRTRRQQNLVQGSLILAVATLLVKILGAIYKIPLGNILGGAGSGYYNTAYTIYLPVYSLAMAGLPVAVSRMVAESAARKRYQDTRKILRIAQRAFLITGTAGTVLLLVFAYFYFFNQPFRDLFGITDLVGNVYATGLIAFSVLFCCIMSSYRGYYEGLRNMFPTAVSQVIEAAGKLVVGLALAWGALAVCTGKMGMTPDEAAPFAAGGAVLGVTLGSAVGAIYLILRHRRMGDGITDEEVKAAPEADATGSLLKALFIIAVPIVIGSLVRDVAALVDLITVKARLTTLLTAHPNLIFEQFGVTVSETVRSSAAEGANYLYGCYTGFAYSLYNLIPTITAVIGVSTIPTLCTAWASEDKDAIGENVRSILKLSSILSLPAGIGIAALSGPILHLLFSSKPDEVIISTPVLVVLGFSAIFAGIAVPTTSMLQAIGKQNVPVINMAVGVVLKIVVNYILVGIEGINIIGAPAGTGVCYAYIMIANLICLKRYTKVGFGLFSTVFKPAFAAVLCGGAAIGGYWLLERLAEGVRYLAMVLFSNAEWIAALVEPLKSWILALFGESGLLVRLMSNGKVITAVCIIIAALVYAICLGFTKTFTENDILMLPKGEKLAKVLAKLHWIG